jgi:hypothetical protein
VGTREPNMRLPLICLLLTIRSAAAADPAWVCDRQLTASNFQRWRHSRDLAGARRDLSSPRGRRTWDDQMVGRGVSDRLGRPPPAFVTRARAVEWTKHPRSDSVDLVAAREWPLVAEGIARTGD